MASLIPVDIQFFEDQWQFRTWLEKNHATTKEVWVGYYKKESKKPSLTWPESVDQALCFGWIDGIRKSTDSLSYTIRFTPRNPKSVWSTINIQKVEELISKGLMQPAGIRAFELRKKENSGIYSFEQESVELPSLYTEIFKANVKAWENYCAMPPSYRRTSTWWVISAKQEETRMKRLQILIQDSEAGLRIAPLRR